MAIITSSSKTKPATNQINQSNLEQLDTVFTSKEEKKVENKITEPQTIEIKTEKKPKKEPSKKDNSDTVLLNLPKGERSKFKAFCALNNITMTDYIYFSMDFVKDMVDQGKFSVGRSGIKIISEE